jgi:pyrrolysine biosynthesis protein PylC
MVSGSTAKLIEIDARFPSQTPTAVYHSTGINMVSMLVDLFTENKLEMPDHVPPRSVIYEHLMVKDGTLYFRGEGVLSHHPGMTVRPGLFGADEVITDYGPEQDSWAATVIITGRDRAEVLKKRRRTLRSVMSAVNIESSRVPVEVGSHD